MLKVLQGASDEYTQRTYMFSWRNKKKILCGITILSGAMHTFQEEGQNKNVFSTS